MKHKTTWRQVVGLYDSLGGDVEKFQATPALEVFFEAFQGTEGTWKTEIRQCPTQVNTADEDCS